MLIRFTISVYAYKCPQKAVKPGGGVGAAKHTWARLGRGKASRAWGVAASWGHVSSKRSKDVGSGNGATLVACVGRKAAGEGVFQGP